MEKFQCKVCKIEKDREQDFRFHSTTGYYSRTCKECQANNERRKRPIKEGRRNEEGYHVKQKTCSHCKETKDRNDNFLCRGKRKMYDKICIVCKQKLQEFRKKKNNKGYYPDGTMKKCNICEELKEINEFTFSKKYNFYAYCCRKCDAERKKGRKRSKPKYSGQIFSSYRSYDENKNLEFSLTIEYIENSLLQPCTYCGYPSTGLDRIDNSLGHTEENCLPCCRDCNTAKMNNFTTEEMMIIGKAIKQVKDGRYK